MSLTSSGASKGISAGKAKAQETTATKQTAIFILGDTSGNRWPSLSSSNFYTCFVDFIKEMEFHLVIFKLLPHPFFKFSIRKIYLGLFPVSISQSLAQIIYLYCNSILCTEVTRPTRKIHRGTPPKVIMEFWYYSKDLYQVQIRNTHVSLPL